MEKKEERGGGLGSAILRHPILAALLTGLTILLGLAGSLYTDDLRCSIDMLSDVFRAHSAEIFWWMFAGILGLWVSRQWVVDRDREKIDARMSSGVRAIDEAVTKIRETVTHMPPLDFLILFRESYTTSADIVSAIESEEEPCAALDASIQAIVTNVMALAKEWDRPERTWLDEDPTYRASIMVYKAYTDDLSEEEKRRLEQGRRQIVNDALPLDIADGYLELVPALSVKGAESLGQDEESMFFALPVMIPGSLKSTLPLNLPGAPDAFVSRLPNWVEDARDIPERCRERGFDGGTVQKLRQYYERDEKGRSIVSIPIPGIGVLNIYRNSPRMLKARKRAEEFSALMLPFATLLGQLLLLRDTCELEGAQRDVDN